MNNSKLLIKINNINWLSTSVPIQILHRAYDYRPAHSTHITLLDVELMGTTLGLYGISSNIFTDEKAEAFTNQNWFFN